MLARYSIARHAAGLSARPHPRRRRLVAGISSLAVAITATGAFTLTGATPALAALDTTMFGVANTDLVTVDPSSGATTLVVTLPFATAGVARQPGTNRIFYFEQNSGTGSYRINYYDPAAGTTVTLANTVDYSIIRVAFRPDGLLSAMNGTDRLLTVNPGTGATISDIQMTGLPGGGGDIAYAPDGTLFIVTGGSLYTSTDGTTATLVGSLGDGATHPALAFGPAGMLFAADSASPSILYRVSTTTGTATAIGPGSYSLTDLASTANRPPTATPLAPKNTPYQTALSFDGTANGTDPDGDPLTVSVTTNGTNGTTSHSGGTVVYTPAPGFAGSDTFTYTISDGNGGTVVVPVTVTVGPPTPGPLTSTGTGTTPQTVTVPPAGTVTLLNGSTPVTTLTVPSQGTYTLNTTTRVITFTPVFGYSGTATPVTYRVTASDGQSGTATYTPTVNPPAGPTAPDRTSNGVGTAHANR